MVHPNRDEISWAEQVQVKASYDRQIAEGVDRPVLSQYREESAYGLGGVRFEFLGQTGLQLTKEADDGPTFIDPVVLEQKV